jgi:hypothetical protein
LVEGFQGFDLAEFYRELFAPLAAELRELMRDAIVHPSKLLFQRASVRILCRLSMSLTQLLVPTYTQMLRALRHRNKYQKQMRKRCYPHVSPDMFPLSTQVQFACVQAQEAIFRLKGEAFPQSIDELLEEGRNAGDRPGSLVDAQARIDETIALLDSLAPDALDANIDRNQHSLYTKPYPKLQMKPSLPMRSARRQPLHPHSANRSAHPLIHLSA